MCYMSSSLYNIHNISIQPVEFICCTMNYLVIEHVYELGELLHSMLQVTSRIIQ